MLEADVLGVKFTITDYAQASEYIVKRARAKRSTAVLALPVHGVIEARRNPTFKVATERADLIVPDGQPVRWFMNTFHNAGLRDRVYGPELTRAVLEAGAGSKLNVFLYGGATEEVLSGFAQWIVQHFPDVRVVGQYREPEFGQYTLTADSVNQSGAEVVFCGLGCPSQEIWIADNLGKVTAVMLGVGAAFSFHSGHLPVAPSWMQRRGLEWLFRLSKEPARLWRRYLFTNCYFLILVAGYWSRRVCTFRKSTGK